MLDAAEPDALPVELPVLVALVALPVLVVMPLVDDPDPLLPPPDGKPDTLIVLHLAFKLLDEPELEPSNGRKESAPEELSWIRADVLAA